MNRRTALLGIGALGIGIAGGLGLRGESSSRALAAGRTDRIEKTEAEWRKILSSDQFLVLRKEKTERAFSSPLDKETRAGTYHCAGCDLDAYSSEAKYDSGTGWPSFWKAIEPNRIGTKTDYYLIYPRTEVHCARCGGHFGHIFQDGPQPTGERHCLNGLALDFRAA